MLARATRQVIQTAKKADIDTKVAAAATGVVVVATVFFGGSSSRSSGKVTTTHSEGNTLIIKQKM